MAQADKYIQWDKYGGINNNRELDGCIMYVTRCMNDWQNEMNDWMTDELNGE